MPRRGAKYRWTGGALVSSSCSRALLWAWRGGAAAAQIPLRGPGPLTTSATGRPPRPWPAHISGRTVPTRTSSPVVASPLPPVARSARHGDIRETTSRHDDSRGLLLTGTILRPCPESRPCNQALAKKRWGLILTISSPGCARTVIFSARPAFRGGQAGGFSALRSGPRGPGPVDARPNPRPAIRPRRRRRSPSAGHGYARTSGGPWSIQSGCAKWPARALLQTGQGARAREQLLALTGSDRDSETCWLLSRCDLLESIPSEPRVAALGLMYRKSHPVEPEPAAYVGEFRCADCHVKIFRDQHQSRHARTLSRRNQLPAVPFPQQPITDSGHPRVSHAFEKSGDGLEVRTRIEGQVYRTIVDYAFGSGDRGMTLVGHDPDGRSLEYRLSFYPGPVGWDVTSGQSLQPHPPLASYAGRALSIDQVRNCMECHVTNPRSIFTGTGPESLDRAIGCEKCHGPGGNHVKVMASKDVPRNHEVDLAIARPALSSGAAIIGLCSQCHAPSRNGAALDPESPGSIRFQGTTLPRSRCYIESDMQLDCVTCHNPHRDAETSEQWYESRCLQCHSSSGPTASHAGGTTSGVQAHRPSSCPVQPTRGCIACHMPRRETTMAHTPFTDHFIRIHREPDVETKRRP